VSVAGLLIFVGGVFGLRMIGGFALGRLLADNDRFARLLLLLPLSIVASVVAIQTFATKQSVVLDARVVGVTVAAVASWKRMPLGIVVVLAAASTALVRRAGWG
jgi:hypothetical protein